MPRKIDFFAIFIYQYNSFLLIKMINNLNKISASDVICAFRFFVLFVGSLLLFIISLLHL